MAANKLVSVILLSLIANTIYCNRTIDIKMINDYVNQDLVKSTTVFAHLCWDIDEKHDLLKLLFENNHTVSIARSTEEVANEYIVANTVLHILDLQCDNSGDLLNHANDKNLLAAPYKWLLLSEDPDILNERIANFTDYDIYPSSNIVISQKTDTNAFILTDIYKYSNSRKELVRRQIANWTEQNKFGAFKPRILSRERQNLNGTLMPISIVILNNDTLNHLEDFRFQHIDPFSKVNYIFTLHIIDFMNATLDLIISDSWGYDINSGMIGYIARGEAEMGGSPFFMTNERIPMVDIVSYTTFTKLKFIFRQPPLSYESNIFTLPFTRSLWISSCGLLMLAIVLLYYAVYWEWQNPDLEITDTALKPDFMEVVMLQIGGVAQQGAPCEPRSGAGKIVMIFSYIALMFLYVSYSANIVALLQSTANNINTLEDLLESRLKLGAHDVPYNQHFFSTASDPIRKGIYERKIAPLGQKPHFMSLEEGMRRVRGGFFAFHTEVGPGYKVMTETFYESEKCNLQEINYYISDKTYLPMRKNCSYREIIRTGYLRIMESGIQARINKRIYTAKPECHVAGGSFVSVGLIDSYPAFLVLGVGIGLSIVLLILETIASRKCKYAYFQTK